MRGLRFHVVTLQVQHLSQNQPDLRRLWQNLQGVADGILRPASFPDRLVSLSGIAQGPCFRF